MEVESKREVEIEREVEVEREVEREVEIEREVEREVEEECDTGLQEKEVTYFSLKEIISRKSELDKSKLEVCCEILFFLLMF
jgi:hypothetical protein